jgi:predicted GH43/DUF377 family glycosyl hydrolase
MTDKQPGFPSVPTVSPLSSYPKREQAKRREVIRRLTDANYILAPYLEQHLVSKNPIRDGFLPKGSDFRDFTIIEHKGRFHAFYIDIRHGKHSRRPDNPFYNGHASTADFMEWEIYRPPLLPIDGTWEGGRVGAPFVFPVSGLRELEALAGHKIRFAMIYTGLSERLCQSLGMAFSADLMHWTRYDTNPFFQPINLEWAEWSKTTLSNCRDPHVMKLGKKYILYYTALQRNGDVCVAAAESTDLEDWTDRGPVLSRPFRNVMPAMLESACVYPIGKKFVITYTHQGGVWFAISEDPFSFDIGEKVIDGFWAMEQVKVKGNRWLVAFFRQHAQGRPAAMHLAVVTWKGYQASVKICKTKKEVAPFL